MNERSGEMKTGRPQKEINQKEFERLCALLCTEEEICGWFDVSVSTISRWCKRTYGQTFKDVFQKKSAGGKMSLRRYQFQLAKTSAAMAIFLGKNYLGQSDGIKAGEGAGYEDDGFIQAVKQSAASVWRDE